MAVAAARALTSCLLWNSIYGKIAIAGGIMRGLAVAALVVAVLAIGGWAAYQHIEASRVLSVNTKACKRLDAYGVMSASEREKCPTDLDVRRAVAKRALKIDAERDRDAVIVGNNKLARLYAAADRNTFPALPSDKDVPTILVDVPKDAPPRFSIQLQSVSLSRPNGDQKEWQLMGNRTDNKALTFLDLSGLPPAFLEEVLVGCVDLVVISDKAGCKANALVELTKDTSMPIMNTRYIVVGLEVVPPSDDDIDDGISDAVQRTSKQASK
jgi:hypothetical protein